MEQPEVEFDFDPAMTVGPYNGSSVKRQENVNNQYQAILLEILEASTGERWRVEKFDGQDANTVVRVVADFFLQEFFTDISTSPHLCVKGCAPTLREWRPEGNPMSSDEPFEMVSSGDELRGDASQNAKCMVRVGFDA